MLSVLTNNLASFLADLSHVFTIFADGFSTLAGDLPLLLGIHGSEPTVGSAFF
jgi:hypothetical protein